MATEWNKSQASCKVIVTKDGSRFFLLVSWHESFFDIQLTNINKCWQKNGITAPQNHARFPPKEWLAHAKDALYDPDPVRPFEFEAEHHTDTGCIELEWTAEYEAGRSYVLSTGPIPAAQDRSAMLESMMRHLCGSYKVLKGSFAKLTGQNAELQTQLEAAQQQCKDQINATQQREAELFVKFTLVLNSKKEHMQHLSDQLAAAQAEVAKLTEQLALQGGDVAMNATTDDEAEIEDQQGHGSDVESQLQLGSGASMQVEEQVASGNVHDAETVILDYERQGSAHEEADQGTMDDVQPGHTDVLSELGF